MNVIMNVTGIDCSFSGVVVEIPYKDDGFAVGDFIIYRDDDGKEEYGVIQSLDRKSIDPEKIFMKSKILRKATPHDTQIVENNTERTPGAIESCKKLVAKYQLDMQVFRAGFSFDGSKVHFMFTADDRVDFRDLVKDLARIFKKQIYLRQVGPRDKAKIVGGYGKCGRSLCCNTFLGKLDSVNMEMVRDQGLESKGSSKLSGSCGKLLCCLRYEVEIYRELKGKLPKIGTLVQLKKSSIYSGKKGEIIALDVLNQRLKLILEDREFVTIDSEDVDKIIQPAKGYKK